jgi:ribonuclease E
MEGVEAGAEATGDEAAGEVAEAVAGDAADLQTPTAEARERDASRRRGRGRDRQPREQELPAQPAEESVATDEAGATEPAPIAVAAAPVSSEAAPKPIETAVVAAAPIAAPIVVEPFVLPMDALQQLARSAGLEWINSDAERILVAQQAMAAEPRPAHVPRVPRPRLVVDEGPLVLVETRKDLSQMKLPFEQLGQPAA